MDKQEQLIQAYYNDASMKELLDIHGEQLWEDIEGAGPARPLEGGESDG